MTQNSINNSASSLDIDNLNLDGNTISSTDTNGNIILAPDGSGTVSVTTAPIVPSGDRADSLGSATNSWDNVYADGLTFDDGTNVLSTFVALTSFTPEIAFGGASVGVTYSSQYGRYARIGNMVYVTATIVLTSKGSSTGTARLITLPYSTPAGAASFVAAFSVLWSNINLNTNYTQVTAAMGASVNTIGFSECGDNVTRASLTDAEFANDTLVTVTGWYITS